MAARTLSIMAYGALTALFCAVFIQAAGRASAETAEVRCSGLTVRLSDDKNSYLFSAAASGDAATITGYTFTFGDRQSYQFSFAAKSADDRHAATVSHTYQTAGTFAAGVSVITASSGKTRSVSSPACKTVVVVPPAGSTLPNTGTSPPVSLAAIVAGLAAGLHLSFQRKRRMP